MSALPPPLHPAPTTAARSAAGSGLSWTARQLIALGGFALVVVGSLMPWVSVTTIFGSVDVAGTNGDGVLAIGLALFGAVGVLLGATRGWRLVSSIAGVAAAALVAYNWANVHSRASTVASDYVVADVGTGIYLCLIGAVVAVAGTALMRRHRG
jgi:hypothetical protein